MCARSVRLCVHKRGGGEKLSIAFRELVVVGRRGGAGKTSPFTKTKGSAIKGLEKGGGGEARSPKKERTKWGFSPSREEKKLPSHFCMACSFVES